MKVLIAMDSTDASSQVSQVFGRCSHFGIFNSEANQLSVVENPGTAQARGAGIAAAQEAARLGVEKIYAGHVGPNAASAIEQAGIEVVPVADKTVQEVIDSL